MEGGGVGDGGGGAGGIHVTAAIAVRETITATQTSFRRTVFLIFFFFSTAAKRNENLIVLSQQRPHNISQKAVALSGIRSLCSSCAADDWRRHRIPVWRSTGQPLCSTGDRLSLSSGPSCPPVPAIGTFPLPAFQSTTTLVSLACPSVHHHAGHRLALTSLQVS